MEKEQSPEETELGYRHVSSLSGPDPLISVEAYAYVGLTDHGNIVSSITDGHSHQRRVVIFDEPDYFCLLRRTHATADYGLTGFRDLEERVLHPKIRYNFREHASLHYHRGFLAYLDSFFVFSGHILTTEIGQVALPLVPLTPVQPVRVHLRF